MDTGRPALCDRPTVADLMAMTGGRLGVHDVPCPACGPGRLTPSNRTRPVLRIWAVAESFATYYCARCQLRGEAHLGYRSFAMGPMLERVRSVRERHAQASQRLELALHLWRRRQPLAGSIAERYLRGARRYAGPLPGTLAYLPAKGDYPPAMLAPFGLANEPEPGQLSLPGSALRGVHLTRLAPDGSGKAGDPEKIMIGHSAGWPIVLAPLNDNLGLAVTEGIEDGLSVHEATGLGVIAAGSASRLPALADNIPSYTGFVSIVADDDPAGTRGAMELHARLCARRLASTIVRLRAAP